MKLTVKTAFFYNCHTLFLFSCVTCDCDCESETMSSDEKKIENVITFFFSSSDMVSLSQSHVQIQFSKDVESSLVVGLRITFYHYQYNLKFFR